MKADYGQEGKAPINETFLSLSFLFWVRWVFTTASRLSLVAASRGYCLVVAGRLLIVVASLMVEHGLPDFSSCCTHAQEFWRTGLAVPLHGGS